MMIRRLLWVLLCYGLSAGGLLACLMFAGVGLALPRAGAAVAVVLVLLAWSCHLVMSLNWVLDRRMGRVVPAVGTAVAVAASLIWPWAWIPERASVSLSDRLGWSGLGLLWVLPCVLLAVQLLRFHLGEARAQVALTLHPAACPPDA
ncbi:hypothetical protein ACU6VI_08615 [Sphaerotilus natans]|uniref:hypothetical protein n=1 Tax=Sphaerotilus natans TaxID=34103 RepID=UPI00406C2A2C